MTKEQIATEVMGWCCHKFEDTDGMLITRRGYKNRLNEPFYQCLNCKKWFDTEDYQKYTGDYLPDFLNDHNAAMMVVEKMREDGWVISMAYDLMSSAMPMPFVAAFYKPTDPINSFRGYSESLCHAICSAALTAKGIKHDLLHRCR